MSGSEAAVCLRSEYTSKRLHNVLEKRGWRVREGGPKVGDHSTLALHWADFPALQKTWDYLLDENADEEERQRKRRLRVSCVYVKCGLVRKVMTPASVREERLTPHRLMCRRFRATCTSGWSDTKSGSFPSPSFQYVPESPT